MWGEGAKPRRPSRFLLEAAAVPGVVRRTWEADPEDGADNPRAEREARVAWPLDLLGDRRPAIEEGAALVRAAADGPTAGAITGAGAWDEEIDLLLAERELLERADPTVELPLHLSVSRVVALAEDPQALALQLRRPLPPRPSAGARRGSAFHAWLEQRFASAALVDIDELSGAEDDELTQDEDLEALRESFLASPWAQLSPTAVEVAVETPVAGITVRGRIDAVYLHRTADGVRWDVVDWKTGEPVGPAAARARAVQLAVYRLAWARLQGVPVDQVDAAFFYAATGRTVRPVDLLDEAGLESLIREATRP
jgi:DNA helicase-2/ATP-dependent DNA helicase PcrA